MGLSYHTSCTPTRASLRYLPRMYLTLRSEMMGHLPFPSLLRTVCCVSAKTDPAAVFPSISALIGEHSHVPVSTFVRKAGAKPPSARCPLNLFIPSPGAPNSRTTVVLYIRHRVEKQINNISRFRVRFFLSILVALNARFLFQVRARHWPAVHPAAGGVVAEQGGPTRGDKSQGLRKPGLDVPGRGCCGWWSRLSQEKKTHWKVNEEDKERHGNRGHYNTRQAREILGLQRGGYRKPRSGVTSFQFQPKCLFGSALRASSWAPRVINI